MKEIMKKQKGITLVALIITIVVLMILAAVSINSITNEGIISKAEGVKDKYEQEQMKEQGMLEYYEELLSGPITVKDAQAKGEPLSTTKNTNVYDEYGNKIVLPAGFKITTDADTVEEGIVIEDCTEKATKGSQFVWIPIGKVNSSKGTKTITLGRYSNFTATNGVYTPVQPNANNPYTSNVEIKRDSYNYTEYQSGSTSAIARNINDFYESVMGTESKDGNGGYYIGRYEAGKSGNTDVTLVCKANQDPYVGKILSASSRLCQNMYEDGYSNGIFSSDLTNSYAWDTAIVFIQTFGKESNSATYASESGDSIDTRDPKLTGVNILKSTSTVDKQLNIYDMAGNCREWLTETCSRTGNPCTYVSGENDRGSLNGGNGATSLAFRPILYIGL